MSDTSLVSVARPRRRRVVTAIVLLVLAAALLGACTTKITAYSDKVRNYFVSGCTNPANGGDKAAALPDQVCKCIYGKISGNNGLSFSEFTKVQDQLRDKKKPLDQLSSDNARKILTYKSQCQSTAAAPATASTTTTVQGSATTVAGSSTTAAGSSSTTVAVNPSSSSTTSTTKAP